MSPDFVAILLAVLLMSAFLLTHWRQVLAFLAVVGVALFLLGAMNLMEGLRLIG